MVFTKVGSDSGILHIKYYETTLKKEGMVDFTLTNPADGAKFHDDDTLDIPGIQDCVPGEEMTIIVHHPDHSVDEIRANCA
ncbi:MAG: hypothetical protein IID08_02075 [Candidatus Hydrogenedentes bacterium]|nr:hypothetical protein [Candidatus Hydrogenedentota bacterium]